MPGIVQQPHQHKPSSRSTPKPFKSRFASKNELRDRSRGRLDDSVKGSRKTPHQHVMSKFDRKNHAKQMRMQKSKQHENVNNIFKGKEGAPRIVAIVPLSQDIAADVVVRKLNRCLEIEGDVLTNGLHSVHIDRFKTSIQYQMLSGDLWNTMDACKVADFVLFVLSAVEDVDHAREAAIRSVESQGIPNVLFAVQGLDSVDTGKRRRRDLTFLKTYVQHFFPSHEKLHSIDNRQDCLNIIRSLCNTTPKGIAWRDGRSYMDVDDVKWHFQLLDNPQSTCSITLTGVVRGQNLKSDRLIHIGDWGEFQISSIRAAQGTHQRNKGKDNAIIIDEISADNLLDQPSGDQDALDQLAPKEIVMGDLVDDAPSLVSSAQKGVLLDDDHFYSGGESEPEEERPRKIPRGTSKYQSAWYLGENSDSGSDMEDVDDWEASTNAPGDSVIDEPNGRPGPSTVRPDDASSEYPEVEMTEDLEGEDTFEEEELAAFRSQRKKDAADEDREFPDEIELHPRVLARERLAKYRGLRSAKTSEWNVEADRPNQPSEWNRLLDISDYRGAKSKMMREALVGGVKPGTKVSVHVEGVPLSIRQMHDPFKPIPAFSLLRHEHKRTCVNVSITLKSDAERPIKSKEELIVQIGARRFVIYPLFSQAGNTSNDVHKFLRYLHPGQSAVASFIAPVSWGSLPVLFFQRAKVAAADSEGTMMDSNDIITPASNLIATGTTLPPSTTRVIAKRALLTGQPYKIHKRLVTIRYMFFNAEDVAWFKALPLWTNRGRQGTIKESLGTHGYFKAVFDGKIGPMDAVGLTLWKRVWPRDARELKFAEL